MTRDLAFERGGLMGEILQTLAKGPVVRWPGGCNQERDAALQALRAQGRIRYRKVADGGEGWELVPVKKQKAAE